MQGGGVACTDAGIINCNYSGECKICKNSFYENCDEKAISYCNDTDQCISGDISVQCSDRSCKSCQSFSVMYDSSNQKTVLKYSACNSYDKNTNTYKQAIYNCNIPTSVPTAEVPTQPAAAEVPPNTCNSSLPSAPVCNGASYNTFVQGLICVPTDDNGNCMAVYPTQPPTNPAATNAPAATAVPGGGSGACQPGEWAVGDPNNCGLHGCTGNESA